MNLDDYQAKDADHTLMCTHAYNSKSKHYYEMDCIKIKDMPNHRAKIVVFGARFWKDTDHIKRVRYVSKSRITPKQPRKE